MLFPPISTRRAELVSASHVLSIKHKKQSSLLSLLPVLWDAETSSARRAVNTKSNVLSTLHFQVAT
ncbi:hypothetical protein, partial [Mucilaginibacter polytrichastri]|uniref:hypothetical protein n=1 Tax=Mucilaginibacter polytrichastri TaxID=1302689 RepID=UPI001C3167D1